MQAVIRATLGISDEQNRKTSPVQSRRWSSGVKAWLDAGSIARQKAKPDKIPTLRSLNRSVRMVTPKKIDQRCGRSPSGSPPGINHGRSYGDECRYFKFVEQLRTGIIDDVAFAFPFCCSTMELSGGTKLDAADRA
jgi:hypothetical protein